MFKKKEKKIRRRKNSFQEYLEAILFAFVVAFLIKNYIFQNFKIPSSSMESTLLIGDYLVADRLKFMFNDPERGDIVTFQYPAEPEEPGLPTLYTPHPRQKRDDYALIMKPIYWDKVNKKLIWHAKRNVVKRVVGLPGDMVEVKDKDVYINGELYTNGHEQYIDRRIIPRYAGGLRWGSEEMGSRDNMGPVVVPEGKYFVMGDNRDVSADSRYWGFLDKHDINGTPLFIFFSKGPKPAKTIRQAMIDPRERPAEFRFDRIFKKIK